MKPHFSVQRSRTSVYRPERPREREREGRRLGRERKMDKVEGKEDKRPVRMCPCVSGCVGCASTGDFPEAWRQWKQGVINFTPTYLASVWGSGP